MAAKFRPDEARTLGALLGANRLMVLGVNWEDRVASLEALVAVAAWRQQSLEDRALALIDALDACRMDPDAARRKWGDDEI